MGRSSASRLVRYSPALLALLATWYGLLWLSAPGGGGAHHRQCDLFQGKWVYDDTSYPLYQISSCPIVEHGFRCQENGRPDQGYTKWRWRPHCYDLPAAREAVYRVMRRLRGKRVAFVGDSMGRTQWESLVCMLMAAAPGEPVHEVEGRQITKLAKHLAFRFGGHDLIVEYFRSPYLVQQSRPPSHSPRRVRSVLKLDAMDTAEAQWRNADVLVFNSGHWWNAAKTHQIGCYFLVAGSLRLGLKVEAAYRIALHTWASWVDAHIDANRTRVFFRSFEPSHWHSKTACSPAAQQGRAHKQSQIIDQVLQEMNTNVALLNITALTDLRSDGHVGNWTRQGPPLDCSHWCLPGVPDTWNELLLYALLLDSK